MSSPTEIIFLSHELVLSIHEDQILQHGGISGLRDPGLLESALAQPMATFGNEYLRTDVFEMAAAYLFHIANNHPFLDGNKRTALVCCLAFLRLNGIVLKEQNIELADMVLEMITEHRDKQWAARELRTWVK